MNKRDVIIISIVINAALLSVLFFTASREIEQPIPIAKEEKIPSPPSIVVPENKENEELIASRKEEPVAYVLPSIVEKEEEKKPSPSLQKEKKKKSLSLPPAFSNTQEIKVKPGDTLEKIAKKYKVSVSQIMTQNHLSDSFLHVGQSLKIPLKKEEPKNSSLYYVVKAGDNPWTIAMKHHIKVDELLKLNQLDEKKARKLKPGDRLRIR